MDQAAPEAAECLNRSLFSASLDSSAMSTSCSPSGINPRRRESKSRAEKKRRDRINVCYQRMHELLEEESRCCSGRSLGAGDTDASGQSPGPEKAEILERIIRYVEQLKQQQRSQQPTDASISGLGSKASASTPERSRSVANVDDSLIKSYMSGYKRGIHNIFILIDRLCNESERLTKTELIEKIKKGYLDSTEPPSIEREKLATAAVAAAVPAPAPAPAPAVCRPALGNLSNHNQPGVSETPTPKKSASAAAVTAAAALIEMSSSTPVSHSQLDANHRHQPPAKKRRAFREQQVLLQLLPPTPPPPLLPPTPPPPLLQPLRPRRQLEAPHYEPISPGPYEPSANCGCGDENAGVGVWRPW